CERGQGQFPEASFPSFFLGRPSIWPAASYLVCNRLTIQHQPFCKHVVEKVFEMRARLGLRSQLEPLPGMPVVLGRYDIGTLERKRLRHWFEFDENYPRRAERIRERDGDVSKPL